ncbi:MAG TPA: hypothetical protein VK191_12905 [Symbiobacteriaceae bacterium]|nr:hypothetical protein [Symbiobacteriaceae bacterium]
MLPSELIERYHTDAESVHATWFLDEGRLKAFRTIKHGIRALVQDLEAGSFANDYRGSTLETVVEAIAEQKQVFAGAAHPFYWKPKLRIPDIYESRPNQQRFAALLRTALRTADEGAILAEIMKLAADPIKGLGPASGNLLYFLHPTTFPPFNTAILEGYNMLTGSKLKLGQWPSYLQMRDGLLQMVKSGSGRLSRDLGDISGLCFEVGSARMIAPELPPEALAELTAKWEKETKKRHREIEQAITEEHEHAEHQGRLAELGAAWGFAVWIARNDHSRAWSKGKLGALTLKTLPDLPLPAETRDTVELIDVLWLDKASLEIVAAFEVERSTSIYSGILRLSDLALSLPRCQEHLYLVAPDKREKEIIAQLCRPSIATAALPRPEYILFADLACNCAQMARFGEGLPTLKKISKRVG